MRTGVADVDRRPAPVPPRPWRHRDDDRGPVAVLQFGVTELDGNGTVLGFHEKPRSDHWINGGFFAFSLTS